MAEYKVTWTIDLDGEGDSDRERAINAAKAAHKIMLDPDSSATCFLVERKDKTNGWFIDLDVVRSYEEELDA